MINFFDLLYSSVKNKNRVLALIRYYSILRFVIRISANVFLPFYFRLTQYRKSYSIKKESFSGNRIIVSLTSFPVRINRTWIVIESILRQHRKPDMIILWLSIDQFPSLDAVPNSLLKLRKRGLLIRLCEDDLRSHKKYFYAMKEFQNDYIITIDDDVIYSTRLLSSLISLSIAFPLAICCNHATRIKLKDGDVSSYVDWKIVRNEQSPGFEIMPIGVGGVMYPPKSLHPDVFKVDVFKSYCFLADDIWLNIMTRLRNTSVAKTSYNSDYLPVINLRNITLNSQNIFDGLNDKQLNATRNYYKSNFGVDPYESIIDPK